MTILALLIGVAISVFLVWLAQRVPGPFNWCIYGFLLVVWAVVLLSVLGIVDIGLNTRVG